MPLSLEDIKRLQNNGHQTGDFMVNRHGERRLRNVDGQCYFLDKDGCTVYEHRPRGCRLYPLVMDSRGKIIVHTMCRLHKEFNVGPREAKRLAMHLKLLKREKRRENKG